MVGRGVDVDVEEAGLKGGIVGVEGVGASA